MNRLDRFELQKALLREGRYFKLVCGAGNEDPSEIYKLTLVYSLAGASGIDLSARRPVVEAACRAVQEAERLSPEFGIRDFVRPFLTVSVGMSGDPHVRKARIVLEKCAQCGACIASCSAKAIAPDFVVAQHRCIGCGNCSAACPEDAVVFSHKPIELRSVLEDCVAAGAENIELHAAVPGDGQTLGEWEVVTSALQQGFVSVCLDRGHLSNHALRRRIELLREHAAGRMIVQADGLPMSGGKDDYNTTLQAVAIADIVAKMGLEVYILISGGTNSRSAELARACGVPFAGVSLGTYGRRLVAEQLDDPAFPETRVLKEAVRKARELVAANSEPSGRRST